MNKIKNVCIEFNVPTTLPYSKYRQFIKDVIIKKFPGLLLRGIPLKEVSPYNPADLNSITGTLDNIPGKGTPVTEEIYLDMSCEYGCEHRFNLSGIPFEDLDCPCGKTTYFKFTKY